MASENGNLSRKKCQWHWNLETSMITFKKCKGNTQAYKNWKKVNKWKMTETFIFCSARKKLEQYDKLIVKNVSAPVFPAGVDWGPNQPLIKWLIAYGRI